MTTFSTAAYMFKTMTSSHTNVFFHLMVCMMWLLDTVQKNVLLLVDNPVAPADIATCRCVSSIRARQEAALRVVDKLRAC